MYHFHMLLLGIAILLFLTVGLPGLLFAPWVPTKRRDFERIEQALDIHSGMRVVDLGCGTGGVLFEMANRHPSAFFEGIELSLPLYLICVIRGFLRRQKNIRFRLGNLLTTDISSADRIYVFGTPQGITEQLKKKLKQEAKAGACLISYCFVFPGWEPEKVFAPDAVHLPVYRYAIHAKKNTLT